MSPMYVLLSIGDCGLTSSEIPQDPHRLFERVQVTTHVQQESILRADFSLLGFVDGLKPHVSLWFSSAYWSSMAILIVASCVLVLVTVITSLNFCDAQ